jgi:hypothetical protein
VLVCEVAADCPSRDVCVNGECFAPAAGDNSECPAGQQAVGASCAPVVAAAAVDTCVVLPVTAVIVAGASQAFSVITFDVAGQAVPYEQTVSWTASDPSLTFAGGSVSTVATASPSAAAANVLVTASVGSVTCTPARLTQYAAPVDGDLRVVVTSADPPVPIPGATVVIDDLAPLLTGADGSVSIANPGVGTSHTISVYAEGYEYLTFVGTLATDIHVPLKEMPSSTTLSGARSDTDFARLADPLQAFRFSVHGASVPGNVMDVELANVLGPAMADQIPPATNVTGLQAGMVAGQTDMTNNGAFTIDCPAGRRALWSFEGNLPTADLINAANLSSGDMPLSILLLPFVGGLESSVVSGQNIPPSSTFSLTASQDPLPDTLFRLNTVVTMPALPQFRQYDGSPGRFDGAILIGGVLSPQGFVPLGMTEGQDLTGVGGTEPPDGLIDGSPEGLLPLPIAPRHGGMETAPWEVVALASSPLARVFDDTRPTPMGEEPLARSGVFAFPSALPWNGGTSTAVDLGGEFLGVPGAVTIDEASRTLSIQQDLRGIAYHRLDVGDDVHLWSIYFPASQGQVTVPTPPGALADRFIGTSVGAWPRTTLFSVSLGYAPSLTYDGVVQFDGQDANDLNRAMDRFSSWVLVRND